ncbi:WD repeat-containing protein 41-like isoform X2 [Amphiura filiformis]
MASLQNVFRRNKGTPKKSKQHEVETIQDDQIHNPYTEIQLLADHSDIVRILLSIDSTRFASAGDDNTIIIWDVKLGRKLFTLSTHTLPITCACLLPPVYKYPDYYEDREERFLTGSSDKKICMWNANTGECMRISQHNSAIKVLSCLEELELFCSGGIELCLWNLEGQLLNTLKLSEEADISHILVITKDHLVVASGSTLEVCIITPAPDMHGGTTYQLERLKKLVPIHKENITCMILVGENFFGTASLDGSIKIWNRHKLTLSKELHPVKEYYKQGYPYSVQHMMFIKEKYLLAAIGCGFCLYDIVSGETIIEREKAHYSRILHLCLVYDSMFLATSSEDGTIRLWGAKPQAGLPQEHSTEKPANQSTLEKLLGTSTIHPASVDSKHHPKEGPSLHLLGECVAHSGAVRMVLDFRDEGMVSCGVADGLVILWKASR